MLLRIVENYNPKELIDNIMGGVPNPINKQMVQTLMEQIESNTYAKKYLQQVIIPAYNKLILKYSP